MHRPATLIGIAVTSLVLCAAPAASAASPDPTRFSFTASFTDPDFCGTEQTVEFSISAMGTHFNVPNQDVDTAETINVTLAWTNPQTGRTVLQRVNGRFTAVDASGDLDGIHTVEGTNFGVSQLREATGPVLLVDAGIVTVRETYDGEEFLDGEVVLIKGPHPGVDTARFCELVPTALGL